MGQAGQHTLIVDDRTGLQAVLEIALHRAGRRVTIAQDANEAIAVLRSSLHPLVVYISAEMRGNGQGQHELLSDLLANPDFAATHAFIVVSAVSADGDEAGAQASSGYVARLRLPAKVSRLIQAQEAAEAWLAARGG